MKKNKLYNVLVVFLLMIVLATCAGYAFLNNEIAESPSVSGEENNNIDNDLQDDNASEDSGQKPQEKPKLTSALHAWNYAVNDLMTSKWKATTTQKVSASAFVGKVATNTITVEKNWISETDNSMVMISLADADSLVKLEFYKTDERSGNNIVHRETENVSKTKEPNWGNNQPKSYTVEEYKKAFYVLPCYIPFIINKDTATSSGLNNNGLTYNFTLTLKEGSWESYRNQIHLNAGSETPTVITNIILEVVLNQYG